MKFLIVDDWGSIRYPIDLRKEFPNTSFPDIIKRHNVPHGVHIVQGSQIPELPDNKHKILEGRPEFKNGVWTEVWYVVPYSQEEIDEKKKELRKARNTLLMHTDWTQLPDIPKETSNKYKKYRQQLRDLPQQDDFPFVELPEICNAS